MVGSVSAYCAIVCTLLIFNSLILKKMERNVCSLALPSKVGPMMILIFKPLTEFVMPRIQSQKIFLYPLMSGIYRLKERKSWTVITKGKTRNLSRVLVVSAAGPVNKVS